MSSAAPTLTVTVPTSPNGVAAMDSHSAPPQRRLREAPIGEQDDKFIATPAGNDIPGPSCASSRAANR